ncbi:MAG: hypothetical protein HYZ37_09420 [Candidatus Solibacter usitatus]|nr:hypothetical protein [Candidatus Solibacter usitatus]
MVENTVLKEQLTGEMIEAGAKLIQDLDEQGVVFPVAVWYFLSERNQWQLVFASPLVRSMGSRGFYEKISEARKALGVLADALPLFSTRVMDTSDRLPKNLLTGLHTGPGLSRIRLSREVIDRHFIDDALVYRIAG